MTRMNVGLHRHLVSLIKLTEWVLSRDTSFVKLWANQPSSLISMHEGSSSRPNGEKRGTDTNGEESFAENLPKKKKVWSFGAMLKHDFVKCDKPIFWLKAWGMLLFPQDKYIHCITVKKK